MNGNNHLPNNKYLIIGASGYLGSLFLENLQKKNVTIFLHVKTKKLKSNIKNIKFIYGDITKNSFWKNNIINKDYLINFASAENTFFNKKSIEDDYKVNVQSGIYALINAYNLNKKIKIIFFGSENQEVNLNVKSTRKIEKLPHNFFGFNKDILERYSIYFKNKLKLKIVFLRFSNIYGPSVNKQLTLRSSYNKIIYNALSGKVNLFENKKSKRDIIYIEDVINAIFDTIKFFNSLKSDYYYICYSKSISIEQFTKLITKQLSKEISKIKIKNIKKKLSLFDHRNFYGDYLIFQKKTKWKPLNDHAIGIRKTINFLKNK